LRKGETFEQLRLHYATLGTPHGLPRSSDLLQLVLSEQPAGANRDIGVVSLKTWRISDQVARHKLLIAGLGWCGMPEPIVHADIESGRLVRSNLRDWRG
jgi:DNA-binding transcriptional LysR family regulator